MASDKPLGYKSDNLDSELELTALRVYGVERASRSVFLGSRRWDSYTRAALNELRNEKTGNLCVDATYRVTKTRWGLTMITFSLKHLDSRGAIRLKALPIGCVFSPVEDEASYAYLCRCVDQR